jgi:predicted Co/Zn/Cd cation transporter (cation efflux family)
MNFILNLLVSLAAFHFLLIFVPPRILAGIPSGLMMLSIGMVDLRVAGIVRAETPSLPICKLSRLVTGGGL